jgi:hypothetical protein
MVDPQTVDALNLPPTGALLARPDGREVRRWATFDAAATDRVDQPTPTRPTAT